MRLAAMAAYAIVLLATAVAAFLVGDLRSSKPDTDTADNPGEPRGEFTTGTALTDVAAISIDELVRQPTEFSFTHAAFSLAARSGATELEAFIQAAFESRDRRRGMAIANIMLSRYAELDPRAAFTFARQARVDQRSNALFRVFADWSAFDPEAALAAVERLRDPGERRPAEDGILQTASLQDPARLGAVAASLGRDLAAGSMAAANQMQVQADPRTALNEARKLPQNERVAAAGSIGGRWAAQDPEAAYRYASELPADPFRDYVMNAIFSAWSRTEPGRVVEVLNSGVSEHERYSIIHYGIAEMARTDPAQAFDLVAGMSNAAARSEALKPLLQVWASDNPRAAVAALESLTTPDVRELATIVGPMFAQSAPVAALDWSIDFDQGYGNTWRYVMGEISRQDIAHALTLARQTPQDRQREALLLVVGAGAQADPDAAALMLLELPADMRDIGTQHVVTEWIKRDAMAAQRWVLSQPPGSNRDRGLEVLIGDQNAAVDRLAALINAIDADTRRISNASSVIRQRFPGDEDGARNLLAQLRLPPEGHEQIRTWLDRTYNPAGHPEGLIDLR